MNSSGYRVGDFAKLTGTQIQLQFNLSLWFWRQRKRVDDCKADEIDGQHLRDIHGNGDAGSRTSKIASAKKERDD